MTPEQAELFSRWLEAQKDRWATCSHNHAAICAEFACWQAMKRPHESVVSGIMQAGVKEVWARRNKAKGIK